MGLVSSFRRTIYFRVIILLTMRFGLSSPWASPVQVRFRRLVGMAGDAKVVLNSVFCICRRVFNVSIIMVIVCHFSGVVAQLIVILFIRPMFSRRPFGIEGVQMFLGTLLRRLFPYFPFLIHGVLLCGLNVLLQYLRSIINPKKENCRWGRAAWCNSLVRGFSIRSVLSLVFLSYLGHDEFKLRYHCVDAIYAFFFLLRSLAFRILPLRISVNRVARMSSR